MASHYSEKILPYSESQLFAMVADIESYPTFLPWCTEASIIERKEDVVIAELAIAFNMFKGKYTSRVYLRKDEHLIKVELVDGPFHHLDQSWKFTKEDATHTRVHFDIDFELDSFFLEQMLDLVFDSACEKMMVAFEKRAEQLYAQRQD